MDKCQLGNVFAMLSGKERVLWKHMAVPLQSGIGGMVQLNILRFISIRLFGTLQMKCMARPHRDLTPDLLSTLWVQNKTMSSYRLSPSGGQDGLEAESVDASSAGTFYRL